jgi:putative flippase GtrA
MGSRFLLVGLGGVALDVFLFNVFRLIFSVGAVQQPSLFAKLASSGVGIYYAYQLHLKWTFREVAPSETKNRRFNRFLFLTLVSLLTPVTILYGAQTFLGQSSVTSDNFWGNFVGTIVAAAFRFSTYKRFVFV